MPIQTARRYGAKKIGFWAGPMHTLLPVAPSSAALACAKRNGASGLMRALLPVPPGSSSNIMQGTRVASSRKGLNGALKHAGAKP